MLLHVSVCDHHQGACTWAWLKLQLLKSSVKITSLCTCRGVAAYYAATAFRSGKVPVLRAVRPYVKSSFKYEKE